ncbi:MAG TPA: hypothetical protein VH000_01715 [Rhizomicrobium sp.]|jgi:hypothetical protein|nr:hypothetical protein [Rhizomicrobium sp.]HEX4532921.1 hypothetical protein [Rhizomicrobium sp.]
MIQDNKDAPLGGFERLSPVETAAYTRDMLESLCKLAQRQGQPLLAHLMQIAALEADSLTRANR